MRRGLTARWCTGSSLTGDTLRHERVAKSFGCCVGITHMIDPESYAVMRAEIAARIRADRDLLDGLRSEIRPLRGNVRGIQPRATTAISLVATDGGINRIQFDPFLVQLVRVVDSSNNEYCLDALTPTTDLFDLGAKQFEADGTPRTPLGHMMAYLGVSDLTALSGMIRPGANGKPRSPSWIGVYRELVEWAVLFTVIRNRDFATDTLIVFDGFLRSKVFEGSLFKTYLQGLSEGIERQWRRGRRRIYLAGVAKRSKVLHRYRLAMYLERILTTEYPAYLVVPRDIENNAYVWSEYARGQDGEMEGEVNKYVGGKMVFVKFGRSPRDPIWPVDIFLPQEGETPVILGHLLSDAINGFPIPFYPLCLQKAHSNAALVDFDAEVYSDFVLEGIRDLLGPEGQALDDFRLQEVDPAEARYG